MKHKVVECELRKVLEGDKQAEASLICNYSASQGPERWRNDAGEHPRGGQAV